MEVETCATAGEFLPPAHPALEAERAANGATAFTPAISGKVIAILCLIVYAALTAAMRDSDKGVPKLWGSQPNEVDDHQQLLAPLLATMPRQANVRYVVDKHRKREELSGRRLGLIRYTLAPRLVRTEGPAEWLLVDGNPEDKRPDPPAGESWTFVLSLGDGLHLYRQQP
jgi:hypothetical protein